MSSIQPNMTNSSVDESLSQLRQLIRRYLSLRGLILLGIFFLLFYWLTGFIDYVPVVLGAQDSPKTVRAIFLLAGIGIVLFLLWRYLIQPLMVSWSDRTVALLIERKFPQANGAIITYVENRDLVSIRSRSPLGRNWNIEQDPSLQSRVANQAAATLGSIDVYDVMQWKPLRLQSGILGSLVAISLLAVLAFPSWHALWSKRLFLLSDELWPRRTSLEVNHLEIAVPNFTGEADRVFYKIPFDGNRSTIPEGQSARLYASASTASKLVPSFVTLSYKLDDGQTGRSNLRRLPQDLRDKRQPFLLDGAPLEKMKQGLTFSIRGGDARIRDLSIDTIPAIAFSDVQLEVQYPDYLRRRQTSTYLDGTIPYQNGLRLPEGVKVTLKLTSTSPLQRCDYRLRKQSDAENALSGTIDVEGSQFTLPLGMLRENLLLEFRAWDVFGHSATEISQYVLTIIEDQLPSTELTLQGIGTSVTPLARLPMAITARDDHDVKDVIARLSIAENATMEFPVDYSAAGDYQKEIDLRDLQDQQKIPIQPGQVLVITTDVDDFFNLDTSTRKASSNSIPLTVVTQDELLVLLDRRELDLRNRLEQIIVEMTQLQSLLSKNLETTSHDASNDEAKTVENDAEDSVATDRMKLVRTQEAKIQIEKSIAELNGIAVQIAALTAELVNNRIDSKDRQLRLEEKIRQPILSVLDSDFKEILSEVQAMEVDIRDNQFSRPRANHTVELNVAIVARLNDILKNMLDIENFNEVVDMLRDIYLRQEELLEKTKEVQKQRALDLFK